MIEKSLLNLKEAELNNIKDKYLSLQKRRGERFEITNKPDAEKNVYKAPSDVQKKLKQVSCDLVSFLVHQMVKEMRKTLDKEDDMFYAGFTEDVFTDMLDYEYSKSLVKNTRMSIVDKIYEQLSRHINPGNNNQIDINR
ncbi:MAG: rod-binding protein [Candidatus Hydrogenedentota bacterium]